MKKLRKFRDWPFKQVEEVARMLYPRAPFEVSNRKKLEWNALTKKAFDFLDNLHEAYEGNTRHCSRQPDTNFHARIGSSNRGFLS